MFTAKTGINKEIPKELSRPVYIVSIVALVIGIVGMVAYVVLGTIFDNPEIEYMLAFSFPFAFGLVLLITINKLCNNADKIPQYNQYTFEEEYFMATTYRCGENVGTVKLYYKDLAKSRESKNYIFMYLNKYSAVAVAKDQLNSDELILLRSFLGLKLV